jgi:hypothetical protein
LHRAFTQLERPHTHTPPSPRTNTHTMCFPPPGIQASNVHTPQGANTHRGRPGAAVVSVGMGKGTLTCKTGRRGVCLCVSVCVCVCLCASVCVCVCVCVCGGGVVKGAVGRGAASTRLASHHLHAPETQQPPRVPAATHLSTYSRMASGARSPTRKPHLRTRV